ncbi:hypothetical protein T484DRAFT_1793027 [Baffinella frigidus]|nr:hypothetical protein T484DRAFT_1793027 [Cryptophyta sp. CCMP2293]
MGANDAVSTPDGKAGAAGKTTPPGKEIVRETKKRGEAWQMLIVKDGAAKEGGEARHSILQIPHPRHGEKTVFFLVGHQVLEVRRSKGQEYSCWFVGDTVQADPGIAVATPIDPLFLAVCHLENMQPT